MFGKFSDQDTNVLFLTDEYLPSSTRAHAKMLHEMARKFISQGFRSFVLTPGVINQKSAIEVENLDGVEVWRFRAFPIRGKGKVFRALNEILMPFFALIALATAKRSEIETFCFIVNWSPSIFFAPVARHFRSKDAFVFLILRDFFPQWAVDQGLLSNRSLITWFFRKVERLNYLSSNVIAVQSPANIKVFKHIYPHKVNLKVLMNWSTQEPIKAKDDPTYHNLRGELKLPLDKVLIFYGGNIGHAQDMRNIIRLAIALRNNANAHFILIGQGDEYNFVSDAITKHHLSNLTLMPSVSQEKYRQYAACADIGLFSLAKEHTAHNVPGKLLVYMVECKPILGSVNSGNDLASIITDANAGLVSYNGDDDRFLINANLLINDEKLRRDMGLNGNQLLNSVFSIDKAYKVIHDSYKAYRNQK